MQTLCVCPAAEQAQNNFINVCIINNNNNNNGGGNNNNNNNNFCPGSSGSCSSRTHTVDVISFKGNGAPCA
jgi:hypothetical protein